MSPSEYRLRNPWTQTHSFYANIGGFAFDLEENCLAESNNFTTKHSRLTLTPRGMALLARCGYLPKISKEKIPDKSKADHLSKMLSILQALWMLAQIVGRLIVALPVTLLEINTLAHIICALIIYVLWWYKPKLINEPTILRGEWVPPVAVYIYMCSQISGWRSLHPGILKKTWIDPECSILAFNPAAAETPVSHIQSSEPRVSPRARDPTSSTSVRNGSVASASRLQSPEKCGSFTTRPVSASPVKSEPAETTLVHITSRLEMLRELQSTRWALAAKAMTLHQAIASRVKSHELWEGDNRTLWLEPITEELVDDSIGNWATENLLRDMSGFVMGMVVWSASMAYGGIHSTAWRGYFPSRVENILWRVSSLFIAGSGLTWILINMLARNFKGFKAYWKKVASLRAHWTSLVGLGSLATICALVYLVIEAFISLRKLPAPAFDTLQWTQLVPHL